MRPRRLTALVTADAAVRRAGGVRTLAGLHVAWVDDDVLTVTYDADELGPWQVVRRLGDAGIEPLALLSVPVP